MIKASDFAASLRDKLIQSRQEKLIAYLGATRNIDIDRATEAWNRMGEESRNAFGAKYDEYVRKQEEAARKQQKLEKIQQDVERDYFMTAQEALAYGIIDEIYQPRKK